MCVCIYGMLRIKYAYIPFEIYVNVGGWIFVCVTVFGHIFAIGTLQWYVTECLSGRLGRSVYV